MKAIETNARISDERKLILQLPSDVHPGQYHILVVIDELPIENKTPNTPLILKSPQNDSVLLDSSPTHCRADIHTAVVAYATQHAGTEIDLDDNLEAASLECLNATFEGTT
ncbi:hypothetical protein [Candidatus Parabeggiatoa sp. HSG14]|uniref:hypothetical protein n=1 Tax=Candidatus Parabeggiatoa sp. HSG14 TaxID=3055593 RepID=UPI0025A77C3D|nr:hypothetical protein [Thiotrichales bacterium HSG14]